MDNLHIFTIPKWLPTNILSHELWAMIFCWKWRLEMKDILIELLYLSKVQCKKSKEHEFCPFSNTNGFRGNTWSYKLKKKKKKVFVNPKCGIKLIYTDPRHGIIIAAQLRNYIGANGLHIAYNLAIQWTNILFVNGKKELYKHIIKDLGINCPQHMPCHEMLKLLLTV